MADDPPAPPAADDDAAPWASRKFWLAAASLGAGIGALFVGKMSDTNYLWLVGLVLGLHGTANIVDKKLNPGT